MMIFIFVCHHIRHTLGIFRFEDIFIFNIHGSRSVRMTTRRMMQILLLEYGGSHLSHYDLSFSNFNIIQFYVIAGLSLYMVLMINYHLVTSTISNQMKYIDNIIMSRLRDDPNEFRFSSCRSILSGPPYQCPYILPSISY